MNGSSANSRSAGKCSSFPLEVCIPRVRPRMEESNEFAGVRICTSYVRTLVTIVVQAGDGEVQQEGGNIHIGLGHDAGPARQHPASRVMAAAWLPAKSKPGLRLHDGQQVSNMQIAVELCLLFSRQSPSL